MNAGRDDRDAGSRERAAGSGQRLIAVAFGSNLGDRRAAIQSAADRVGTLLDDFRLSPLIETVPVGAGLENDPPFLNAAGVGVSDASAKDLLRDLLAIERALGRTRPFPGAPRVIDLDLILVDGEVIHEPGLEIPHPRFRERRFVLKPLSEIAPDLKDPVSGKTVAELLDELPNDKKGPRP
jgi:2-amino-4-hydroxy-6-hydroxymethyldihydropteridine diphosphokinase